VFSGQRLREQQMRVSGVRSACGLFGGEPVLYFASARACSAFYSSARWRADSSLVALDIVFLSDSSCASLQSR